MFGTEIEPTQSVLLDSQESLRISDFLARRSRRDSYRDHDILLLENIRLLSCNQKQFVARNNCAEHQYERNVVVGKTKRVETF